MKKILLPTDFSESAWNAIAYALQLFKNETCTFYVLNTYEYAISRRSTRSLTDSQKGSVFQAQKENSESDLSDTVNKIHKEFKNTKHTFKTSSMNASFTDGLEKSIEKFKIDMIVMATTGTNLVKEMTFGSSFTALVGTINCPILAIPFDVDYKPLKEIGIACDYEFLYTKKLLKPLIEIAVQQKSYVAVLHVLNEKDNLNDAELMSKENLKQVLPKKKTEFYTLSNINVPDAIQAFTQSRKLDLICIIAKKYGILEQLFGNSHSKSISKQTQIPLLILHCSDC